MPAATARTSGVVDDLLDHELDSGPRRRVVKDPDVLQTDERLEDLTRVGEDEGASLFFGSHLKPEAPSSLVGEASRNRNSPLHSDEGVAVPIRHEVTTQPPSSIDD